MKILFPIKNYSHGQKNYLNLHFRNRLGVAAGLDKNGDYVDVLDSLGLDLLSLEPLHQNSKREIKNLGYLDI